MKTFSKRFSKVDRTFDLRNTQTYVPSPVASVRYAELPDKCFKFLSDVNFIFNQMRLVRAIGLQSVSSWLDGFDKRNPGIDTSKFTDDELLSFIKSRNLQTPSELRAWSDYLMSNISQIKSDMASYAQQELSKLVDKSEVIENEASPKTE